MGLDMYLRAKNYLWGSAEEDVAKAKQIAEILGFDLEVKEVTFRGMYWRKANAIHGWFINNVAEKGVDDCQEMNLSREQLETLRSDCIKALANPDRQYQIENNKVFYLLCDYLNSLDQKITVDNYENPLEPSAGFFFGSDDLGDYYYSQLEYTIDLITTLLEQSDQLEFIYRASW
jgi:hypothetical protein